MQEFANDTFWVGLAQIIGVNIVLSGDNAVVIALAARGLPARQQKMAVLWGSGAAVVMRVLLTVFAVALLTLPWLKLIGAALLLWIGVKLLMPEEGEGELAAGDGMMAAIRTILVADLVMSLDNVIAVAAAAKGSYLLLILGLAISVPLVVFGATLLLRVMQRFPVIITIGAGLLGWVAGEMATSDPVARGWIDAHAAWLHAGAAAIGAAFVVALGSWLGRRALARIEQRAVDLAAPEVGRGAPGGTNG
jgi:YjbE family integral membrane protein